MTGVRYPTREETSPSLAAIVASVDLAVYPFREQSSPDGTVTVAFTDIEGSTAMLERVGEQRWLEVMREHNRIVRTQVAAREGVVVKSQGDGFMLLFASARAALACALDLQQILSAYRPRAADEHLRLRIGLHTGNVFEEQDDFLGKDVIMAARITGSAEGGEVLTSETTKRYTEQGGRWTFGPGLDVQLKGLTDSQRLYSVHRTAEPPRGG